MLRGRGAGRPQCPCAMAPCQPPPACLAARASGRESSLSPSPRGTQVQEWWARHCRRVTAAAHPSLALHRAQDLRVAGGGASAGGGGRRGGLCPRRLCRAGPAALEAGEGPEVSGGGLSPGAGRHPPQRLLGPLPRPSPPQEDREESILPREDGSQPAVSTFPCTRLLDGVAGSAGPPCTVPRQPVVSGCLRDRAASLCQLFCFLRCRQASVTQLRDSPRSPPLSPRGPSQLASSSPSFSLTTSGPRQAGLFLPSFLPPSATMLGQDVHRLPSR